MIQVYHENKLVGHLRLAVRPGQRDIVFQNWNVPDDPMSTDVERTVYRLEQLRSRFAESGLTDLISYTSRQMRVETFRQTNQIPIDAEVIEIRDPILGSAVEFRWNAIRADIDRCEELFDRDEFEPL